MTAIQTLYVFLLHTWITYMNCVHFFSWKSLIIIIDLFLKLVYISKRSNKSISMHFFVAVILSSAKSKARSSWTKKPCNRITGIYFPSGIIPLDRAKLHLGLSFIRICVCICICVTNYNTARLSHRLVVFCSRATTVGLRAVIYHRRQRTGKISFHACGVRNVCVCAPNFAHAEGWIIRV